MHVDGLLSHDELYRELDRLNEELLISHRRIRRLEKRQKEYKRIISKNNKKIKKQSEKLDKQKYINVNKGVRK